MENLTPAQIVAELDKYVVGQAEAKRALAVALRNRYRRSLLPEALQKEITPKNILMIGPTGVGKTELARRLARIIEAPFLKVEATKFTEVGYVGRDVESIVHDVVDEAINLVQDRRLKEVQGNAESIAVERVVGYLCEQRAVNLLARNELARPLQARLGSGSAGQAANAGSIEAPVEEKTTRKRTAPVTLRQRRHIKSLLEQRQLDEVVIEIETLTENEPLGEPVYELPAGMNADEIMATFNDYVRNFGQLQRKRTRKVPVKEALRVLTREEAQKLVDFDQVIDEAMELAEQTAVVFIDEIDKIVHDKIENGADVSGQGVQRDLLPIVEGSVVMTRYGPVKSDHMLFISAGSFHNSKPSDLIPEFQGRFPLRVELTSLDESDFRRILEEPQNSLVVQYQALLATEGIDLAFSADGIAEIARIARLLNERIENIGARRLHTVMEKLLEELSFQAPQHAGQRITVDRAYVQSRLNGLVKDEDLSRYIL